MIIKGDREQLSRGLNMALKGSNALMGNVYKRKVDIEAFGNVLTWFGPFGESILRTIKHILEKK